MGHKLGSQFSSSSEGEPEGSAEYQVIEPKRSNTSWNCLTCIVEICTDIS